MVASGAGIKPGEPGEALHREPLDAGDVPRRSKCPSASCAGRRDRWGVLGSRISITGPNPRRPDMMRRLTIEELYRFDGTPLFRERRAYTASYSLSVAEAIWVG